MGTIAMTVAQALRSAHRRAITENPVSITIQRRERIAQDGGFREETRMVGPMTVRIHQERTQSPHDIKTLAGTAQSNRRWSLIADDTADLRAGPHVVDEFEVAGMGRFRVVSVIPLPIGGTIYGYQAELERVT